jgi:hypothetical protein
VWRDESHQTFRKKNIVSIFQEEAERETSMKQAGSRAL